MDRLNCQSPAEAGQFRSAMAELGKVTRNVTCGEDVHAADIDSAQIVGTVCGIRPLSAETWAFTDDKVTCEECKR